MRGDSLVVCAILALQLQGAQVLFEGARVIVDARKAPIEDAAFVVDNGRIMKMGKRGKVHVPAGVAHVDLTGKTVMAALIDPHVHLGYQKDASYAGENFTRDNVIDQLNRYAYAGVAAVMSLGTDIAGAELQVRGEGKTATRLFTAGRGFAAPNAGPGTPAMRGSSVGVTHEAEARQGVRDQLAKHVDIIKIWVDDRNGTVKKLEPALYRAIIDEAHKHGAQVIAHVYYLDDAKDLVRAGIDGFSHLVRDKEMDDETVALIKQRQVFIMPNMGLAETRTTMTPPAWLNDPLYNAVTPAAVIERVRASYAGRTADATEAAQKTYTIMEHNLAKLNKAGALIGFGADSGAVPDYFHAFTTHRELELMVHAGMTPAQALTSVTVNSAAFLRLADHGTLGAGKSADFLVLDANPLENVSNTRKIARVYMRGEELRREALLNR
jgi:imidazolonepropionase-like amidohydrolase